MKALRITTVLTLALALAGAAPAQAQLRQAEFSPYWYVQPQAGVSWTTGEASLGRLLSPAAQLGVGRQFTPLFGLRLGASGWQGRNWQVAPAEEYKWKYVQASLDAMLSLTNLFGGNDAARRWNIYAFLGAGLNIAFDNGDANVLAAGHPVEFAKVWDGTYCSPAVRGGLGVEYTITERVGIGLEANANLLPDKWNSKPGSTADWQNHLLLGVKIALGKTSDGNIVEQPQQTEQPAPVVEQPVVVEQPQETEQPAPVVEQPVVVEQLQETEQPVVEEPVPAAKEEVKVYFAFNSSRISMQEAQKLRRLARQVRRRRGCRLSINGYASPEGRRSYNKALSGWRAEAVKQCLVSYGVAASRISTEGKGEIDLGNVRESRSAISITIE